MFFKLFYTPENELTGEARAASNHTAYNKHIPHKDSPQSGSRAAARPQARHHEACGRGPATAGGAVCAALCGVRAQAASPRGAGPQAQRSRLARSCRRRRRRSRSRSRTRTRSGHGARPERDAARSTRAVSIFTRRLSRYFDCFDFILEWDGMSGFSVASDPLIFCRVLIV